MCVWPSAAAGGLRGREGEHEPSSQPLEGRLDRGTCTLDHGTLVEQTTPPQELHAEHRAYAESSERPDEQSREQLAVGPSRVESSEDTSSRAESSRFESIRFESSRVESSRVEQLQAPPSHLAGQLTASSNPRMRTHVHVPGHSMGSRAGHPVSQGGRPMRLEGTVWAARVQGGHAQHVKHAAQPAQRAHLHVRVPLDPTSGSEEDGGGTCGHRMASGVGVWGRGGCGDESESSNGFYGCNSNEAMHQLLDETEGLGFDSNMAMHRLLDEDWSVARRSHGLEWFIVNCQQAGGRARCFGRSVVHAELDGVYKILWHYRRIIYGSFEMFATLDMAPTAPDMVPTHTMTHTMHGGTTMPNGTVPGSKAAAAPTTPAFTIRSGSFFGAFVKECHVISAHCSMDDVEQIFDGVQSSSTDDHTPQPHRSSSSRLGVDEGEFMRYASTAAITIHPTGSLTRSAWLEVLVRLAVRKYSQVRTDAAEAEGGAFSCDVAVAVEQLCRDVLMRHLPPEVVVRDRLGLAWLGLAWLDLAWLGLT